MVNIETPESPGGGTRPDAPERMRVREEMFGGGGKWSLSNFTFENREIRDLSKPAFIRTVCLPACLPACCRGIYSALCGKVRTFTTVKWCSTEQSRTRF